MALDPRRSSPLLVRGERRISPRIPFDQLPWLEHVALDLTKCVSIIDLSAHGALIEIDVPARPGVRTQFELRADDQRAVVTGCVLRTQVSGLTVDGIRYRCACSFAEPLPWKHRLEQVVSSEPRINVPPPYSPSEAWSEVRVTFLYGKTIRGYTSGFEPRDGCVNVWAACDLAAPKQTIPVALIRKLVFVKALGPDGVARPISPAPPSCLQPVEVEFRNNEVASGSTLGYSEGDGGLWVFATETQPAIFAVASSVREIRFY
jgi:hypothetical protein